MITKKEWKERALKAESELGYVGDSFKLFIKRNDKTMTDLFINNAKLKEDSLRLLEADTRIEMMEKEIEFLKTICDREKIYQSQFELFLGGNDEKCE